MTQISHDAFARTSTMRDRVYVHSETCAFCGGINWTKNKERFLYTYTTVSDDRPSRIRGGKLFCSVACWRAYNS